MDEKNDLDAIIHKSRSFIDHCQHRADEHDPRRRTVNSHDTNGKLRFVITIDLLVMATQADTCTSTFPNPEMEETITGRK